MKRTVKRHDVVQPLDQSIKIIPLTKGQNAIVDAADYEWLMQWSWHAFWQPRTKCFYAKRSHGPLMHRVILDLKSGDPRQGEHIKSGQTLDNRRGNLRIASASQNACNTRVRRDNKSGFKGVYLFRKLNKYGGSVMINGKRKFTGLFDTPREAFVVRNKIASELHGEFANAGHR